MRHNFVSAPKYATESGKARAGRLALRGILGAATVAALAGVMSGTAAAVPGETDEGTTTANVGVESSIALTGLTADFALNGVAGATITGIGSVTMTVETNNLAGYAVTVESQTATLVPTAVGNTDSIPIAALKVRETGTTPYLAMSAAAPVPVYSQDFRSAEGGDDLSNDYEIVVPFVNEDTYSATLDYIATTL